ncbi:hypothetical protein ACWGLF_43320 [Streptomyces puniciscabiei]
MRRILHVTSRVPQLDGGNDGRVEEARQPGGRGGDPVERSGRDQAERPIAFGGRNTAANPFGMILCVQLDAGFSGPGSVGDHQSRPIASGLLTAYIVARQRGDAQTDQGQQDHQGAERQ